MCRSGLWDANYNFAYCVGQYFERAKYLRDIIIQFPNWLTKSKVLDGFLDNPNLEREGGVISLFPDLSSITISKRQAEPF